ncbi:hypothetical protein BGZ60DRAFT_397018 [Tricladium varicosporioides]|nr:hypothetical protein BGZ60DRAFT_397018 [Hymenoscyphus varicosporioides]
MGRYYNDAVLTLSALHSASAIGGMLKHRPPTRASKISPRNIYIRRKNVLGWTGIFASAPLASRGWALQERLLSRRVLHYSKEEFFWECMTYSRREGVAGFFMDAEKHCHPSKHMEMLAI